MKTIKIILVLSAMLLIQSAMAGNSVYVTFCVGLDGMAQKDLPNKYVLKWQQGNREMEVYNVGTDTHTGSTEEAIAEATTASLSTGQACFKPLEMQNICDVSTCDYANLYMTLSDLGRNVYITFFIALRGGNTKTDFWHPSSSNYYRYIQYGNTSDQDTIVWTSPQVDDYSHLKIIISNRNIFNGGRLSLPPTNCFGTPQYGEGATSTFPSC